MNTRSKSVFIAGALSILIALKSYPAPASVEGYSMTVWNETSEQMIDLIESGYQVMHIENESPRGTRLSRYYLQSGKSLARCDELRLPDVSGRTKDVFSCYKLVRPQQEKR